MVIAHAGTHIFLLPRIAVEPDAISAGHHGIIWSNFERRVEGHEKIVRAKLCKLLYEF